MDIYYLYGNPHDEPARRLLSRYVGGSLPAVKDDAICQLGDVLIAGCADHLRQQEDCILRKRLIAFAHLAADDRYDLIYSVCAASYVDQQELMRFAGSLIPRRVVAGAVGVDASRRAPYVSGASTILSGDIARQLGSHRKEIIEGNAFGFRDDVTIGHWIATRVSGIPLTTFLSDIDQGQPMTSEHVFVRYPQGTVSYVMAPAEDLDPSRTPSTITSTASGRATCCGSTSATSRERAHGEGHHVVEDLVDVRERRGHTPRVGEESGDGRRRRSSDGAPADVSEGSGALDFRTAAVMLAPLLVVALVLVQLWLAGARNVKVIAANLQLPRLSSGQRVVDLVDDAAPRARVFNVTLGPGPATTDVVGRVRVQLASAGQTRILIVREGHRDGSRWAAIGELLRGRARLAVVADRAWLDLGPLPPGGQERRLQVVGILGGWYSFYRLVAPSGDGSPLVLDLEGWSGDGMLPSLQGARFEVVAPDPVGAAEVVTRVLFFVRQSRILVAAAVLAAIAFVIGWLALDRPRHSRAAFLLLASAVLVHAILLPPLQGADETSHVATVEGLAAKGVGYRSGWYPESIAVAARTLDQDRVQYQPAEPLPLRDDAERAALDRVLSSPLDRELQRPGAPPARAFALSADARAPAFYQVFRVLGPIVPSLSIADRLALYRLTSVAMALGLLGAGLALLVACGLGDELGTPYCAIFTFPYAVIALASCSNYAPAIGVGGIVGAAAVGAVLAPGQGARRASRAAMLVGVWLGVAVWRDFAIGAVLLTALVALGVPPFADPPPRAGRLPRLAIAAAGALVGLLVLWTGLGGLDPARVARILTVFDWGDSWLYALAAAPLVLAVLLAELDRRHRARSPERRRREAIASSLALATVLVLLWVMIPPTRVPYEKTFLRGWEFLATATATVLSTNLSWDQDSLTWKFVLGAGGWHDVFFPDAVYAIARWLAVLVLLSLPVLSLRYRLRRPHLAAALLLLSGMGLTLMATSLALRHAALVHPHGRFALPWLGLALLPMVARVRSGQDRTARLVLRGAVLFHLWASFVVVGLRYTLGS